MVFDIWRARCVESSKTIYDMPRYLGLKYVSATCVVAWECVFENRSIIENNYFLLNIIFESRISQKYAFSFLFKYFCRILPNATPNLGTRSCRIPALQQMQEETIIGTITHKMRVIFLNLKQKC